MVRKKAKRTQRKTLLVVGEGYTEVAFLNYLKGLYCRDKLGAHVTVKNAHGKGPENIVQTAIREQRRGQYDKVAAVLDTDIPWRDRLEKEAREHLVELIGNSPCVEALFLRLLGELVPDDTAACKMKIKSVLAADLLNKDTYADWCTREKLELLRNTDTDTDLDNLLNLYEGS